MANINASATSTELCEAVETQLQNMSCLTNATGVLSISYNQTEYNNAPAFCVACENGLNDYFQIEQCVNSTSRMDYLQFTKGITIN